MKTKRTKTNDLEAGLMAIYLDSLNSPKGLGEALLDVARAYTASTSKGGATKMSNTTEPYTMNAEELATHAAEKFTRNRGGRPTPTARDMADEIYLGISSLKATLESDRLNQRSPAARKMADELWARVAVLESKARIAFLSAQ